MPNVETPKSVILAFLEQGLINVDGDDTKLEKLNSTSAKIAGHLRATPQDVLPFVYAAIDPSIAEDDPAIEKASDLLKEIWPTHVNTFSGIPVLVLRAMILNALISNAQTENVFAQLLSPVIATALPYVNVGSEAGIWSDALFAIQSSVEDRAEDEWAVPDEIKIPKIEFGEVEPLEVPTKLFSLNLDALTSGMVAASGPHDREGNPPEDPNPHWPNASNNWSYDFAPRAAKAIKSVVDPALKIKVGPIDSAILYEQITNAIDTQLQSVLGHIVNATQGIELRTRLIWWKEALYSTSARKSYKELDAIVAAGLMAFDLQTPLPALTPISVTTFLRETVLCHPTAKDFKPQKTGDLVKTLAEAKELAPLANSMANIEWAEGRRPLIACICNGIDHVNAVASQTVFDPNRKIMLPDFSSILFMELQALKSLALLKPQKAARKKR